VRPREQTNRYACVISLEMVGVMLRDRLVGNPDQTGTVMSSIILIVTVEARPTGN
jgi:hypothetical protein